MDYIVRLRLRSESGRFNSALEFHLHTLSVRSNFDFNATGDCQGTKSPQGYRFNGSRLGSFGGATTEKKLGGRLCEKLPSTLPTHPTVTVAFANWNRDTPKEGVVNQFCCRALVDAQCASQRMRPLQSRLRQRARRIQRPANGKPAGSAPVVDYAIIMLAAGVFAWVASWARILPITMNVYRVVVLGRNTDCVTGVLYARVYGRQ